MRQLVLSFFSVALVIASARAEPETIFLVRHAERSDASPATKADDPELSEAGRARAESLGEMLRDAPITAIYTTEYKRTQQTAMPLAKSMGLGITVVPAKELAALIAKLKASQGNALVVGHSNTIPEIVRRLGITSSIAIPESDYGDLFVVLSRPKVRLIHLHYR